MVGDIQRSLQMFDAVYRQSAKISRMIDLINSGGAVSEIQRRQAEVNWALSSAKNDIWQQDLFRATRHLHELGRRTSVDLFRAHQSWLHEIGDVIERPTRSWILAQLTLSDISHHLTTSKLLWTRIDYNALARSLNIQQATMSKVQASISALTISYRNLTESFGSVADVVKLPSFVLPGATSELSTTGYALEVLRPFDDELESEGEEVEVYTGFEDQSEDPPPEGLGGHDLLTQADAGCPTGQVMRHHLDRQPGAVGGEAPRRHVVQPDAVLEVAL